MIACQYLEAKSKSLARCFSVFRLPLHVCRGAFLRLELCYDFGVAFLQLLLLGPEGCLLDQLGALLVGPSFLASIWKPDIFLSEHLFQRKSE